LHLAKLLFAKYKAFFVGLLAYLGGWGVLVIAILDGIVPVIPLDPVVASYVYGAPHHAWIYILSGAIGSAVGSMVPFYIGRAGGELLLLKRIDRHRLEAMRDKYESQEFFFIMIPCMLPPGTPMKLIILAAGAFEMRAPLFFLAIFIGRILRFSILAYLVIKFGPGVIHVFASGFVQALPAILGTVGVLLLSYGLYKTLQRRRKKRQSDSPKRRLTDSE
jgi:membrane protein YqaA with SNARE-associated domain